jgi:hypothetical protein
MHVRPQCWVFKVWVHAWERGLHTFTLRFVGSQVNALAGGFGH